MSEHDHILWCRAHHRQAAIAHGFDHARGGVIEEKVCLLALGHPEWCDVVDAEVVPLPERGEAAP